MKTIDSMRDITFVIGGCRSGKSSHALCLAEQIEGHRYYIATCIPHDDEMKDRVANHQQERSADWKTVEEPILLSDAILKTCKDADVILIDCLTLWVSNLLMENDSIDMVTENADMLIQALKRATCPVILVSNEVGTGIVPENKLARLFRDAAGLVNQKVASAADNVIWTVAGIPVPIKGQGKDG